MSVLMYMHIPHDILRAHLAVVVEWEMGTVTAAENTSNVCICASVVNPDLSSLLQAVQLQVFTINSTAQGTATYP